MAEVKACSSLSDLDDVIIRNVLLLMPKMYDVLCFEGTSRKFKRLVDEHLRNMRYADLHPGFFYGRSRHSPEQGRRAKEGIRRLLMTRFSGQLKEVKMSDDDEWVRHELPLHHPQLFPVQLMLLYFGIERDDQSKHNLRAVLCEMVFGDKHKRSPKELSLIRCAGEADALKVLVDYLDSLKDEQIVARVKSELSIFEQLELSDFPLRSEDILKWFKNVKLVTHELEQNIPDDYVADIEKLTKKIQLNIRLSWRDYGDIFCCIAPYITHIVFNNDTSDFDKLSQIPRLQSIRVRADAGTVDICDWLPLKEPPIDVEVEVYTCDVEVFEEMASGDRGPKITGVYGKSITELELGRLVDYMKTSCPNIRNLGLSLDGVQNLFVPTLNMEQFVDFFKQLGQKLLDLYVYADIDLVVLDAILEHCSNLRSLQISHVCLDNKRDHRPIIAKLMRMLKVDDPCIVLKKYMVSSNSSNPQDFIYVFYCNNRIYYS